MDQNITETIQGLKEKLLSLVKSLKKGRSVGSDSCSISFPAGGIAIADIQFPKGTLPKLQLCEFIPNTPPAQLPAIIQKYQLQQLPCTWVLEQVIINYY